MQNFKRKSNEALYLGVNWAANFIDWQYFIDKFFVEKILK
jgi:hypothetical protein